MRYVYCSFKNKNKEKGVTLLFTLIFLITLTLMSTAYLRMITGSTRHVNAQLNNIKALYLSEAGLNKAVWYLENTAPDGSTDGTWRTASYPTTPGPGPNDPKQETLSDGTFTLWVETQGSNILITARGKNNNLERNVQQQVLLVSGTPNIVSSVINTWKEI